MLEIELLGLIDRLTELVTQDPPNGRACPKNGATQHLIHHEKSNQQPKKRQNDPFPKIQL